MNFPPPNLDQVAEPPAQPRRTGLKAAAAIGILAVGTFTLAGIVGAVDSPAATVTPADSSESGHGGDGEPVDIQSGVIAFSLGSEVSPEDETVFERFDQCLADAGWDDAAFESAFEAAEGSVDPTDIDSIFEEADQAAEGCEPILEELSPALQEELDSFEDGFVEFEVAWCDADDEAGDDAEHRVGDHEFRDDDDGDDAPDDEEGDDSNG
ncbi:MAG: hypothetical protein QNM02_08605 [Acidimicrobiia bacterium]|nr:hypothetical protein [Acidimicrobiia bacterium]